MTVARRHLRAKPHQTLGHYGTLGPSEKEKEIKRALLAHGRLPTFDRAKIAPHDEDTYALPPVIDIPEEENDQDQGESESGKGSAQGGGRSAGSSGGGPIIKNSRSDPMPENMRVSMGRMEGKTQVSAVATAMSSAKTSVTAPAAAPAPAKGMAQGIKAAVAAVILVFNGHAVDLDGFMGHSLQPENRITPGDSVRSIVGTGIASPKENPRFWKALGD